MTTTNQLELLKLLNKAFSQVPNSKSQLKTREKNKSTN